MSEMKAKYNVQNFSFAKGGNSEIFRASGRGNDGDTQYAVKKISKRYKYVQSEINNIKLCKEKNIPNTVKAHDIYQDQHHVYIVMNYFPQTLRSIMRDTHSFDFERLNESMDIIQYIFGSINKGLAQLHKHCIIHRDIKPENIFISGSCRVCIGDMGFSKIIEDAARTGLGTAHYKAEEIGNQQQYNNTVDNFAEALIMMEWLDPPIMTKLRKIYKNDKKQYYNILNGLYLNDNGFIASGGLQFGCKDLSCIPRKYTSNMFRNLGRNPNKRRSAIKTYNMFNIEGDDKIKARKQMKKSFQSFLFRELCKSKNKKKRYFEQSQNVLFQSHYNNPNQYKRIRGNIDIKIKQKYRYMTEDDKCDRSEIDDDINSQIKDMIETSDTGKESLFNKIKSRFITKWGFVESPNLTASIMKRCEQWMK